MNLSIAPKKFSIDPSSSRSGGERSQLEYPRPLSRPQGWGRDYQGVVSFVPVSRPAARLVPPPDIPDVQLETPRRGLMGSFLALLRGGSPRARQLHLAETVSLGEKRFVAIIHAEGHKYLVGGGSSGVALLTRLDDSDKLVDSLPPMAEAIEAAS